MVVRERLEADARQSDTSDTEIPDSSIVAVAATSRSSIDGTAPADDASAVHASGSNPSRFVKRQCSSRVVGSASER